VIGARAHADEDDALTAVVGDSPADVGDVLEGIDGEVDQLGPTRPTGTVAEPVQIHSHAPHVPAAGAGPSEIHPQAVRSMVVQQAHVEEDDRRRRRTAVILWLILGFADHSEQTCRTELHRTLSHAASAIAAVDR
jgi:hypothetical protein